VNDLANPMINQKRDAPAATMSGTRGAEFTMDPKTPPNARDRKRQDFSPDASALPDSSIRRVKTGTRGVD
jgi:hypothetical protein